MGHWNFHCRMKNFLNKQREVLAVLVYLAIIAGLVYLVILPILNRMGGMNDQIQQEAMKQESVKLHINELPRIQQQYQTLQKDGDLAGVLLDKNKAVILIERLEKLAESTNNKITIAVQDNTAGAQGKKMPAKGAAAPADTLVGSLPSADYLQLKITLTGDYNSVVRFVGLLEKFEYYGDITAVQITKDSSLESQQTPGSGMFGSTNQIAANDPKVVAKQAGGGALTASLDTVFYTN